MDYEKKYKEALERAKQFSEKPYLEDSKGIVEYIFPELKESEDKKILRSLKAVVKEYDMWPERGLSMNDVLTWLEKQGEQKPYGLREECKDCQCNYAGECKGSCAMKRGEQKSVKVPKFKVGDKVYTLRNRFECTIESIDETTYYGDTTNFDIKDQNNWKLVEQKPWSEEDEIIVDVLYAYAEKANQNGCPNDAKRIEAAINKLKSLRPQSQWKPSDEQIKVCKEVYADLLSAKGFDLGTVNSELNRLEEELKKLKG